MHEGKRPFAKRVYAIPFGRYQAGGEAEPPANEVLVGREGLRAYFIDILLRSGRRGAFLVTGHRGVGKTSFVRYCLTEYGREVYDRFLRSSVGKAFFWDRILVYGLILFVLFLALLTSEIIEILIPAGTSGNKPQNILPWLLITPLAIICAYPLLFAREVFSEVIATLFDRKSTLKRPGQAISFLLLPVLIAAFWWVPPFGAPAISMSRLLGTIGTLYLWVQCSSFRVWNDRQRPPLSVSLLQIAWYLSTIGLVVHLALAYLMPSKLLFSAPTPRTEIWCNICLALSFFGTGSFFQGVHRLLMLKHLKPARTAEAARAGAWRYSAAGLLLGLLGALLLWRMAQESWRECFTVAWQSILYSSAVFGLCHLAWFLFLRSRKAGGGDGAPLALHFQSRPRLALSVKACFCLVIGLQLIHPVVAAWPYEIKGIPLLDQVVPPSCDAKGLYPPQPLASLQGLHSISPQTVFHGLNEEALWVLGAFLILAALYYLDYEWIVRPYRGEREDETIGIWRSGPADGSPEEKQPSETAGVERKSALKMVELTLPWLLYRSWLPVLTISVNLGFEKLDHRRVIQSMLTGLRVKYHRAFLSWNSGLANLGRILGGVLLLLVVSLVGERWFSMPSIQLRTETHRPQDLSAVDLEPVVLGRAGAPGETIPPNYVEICHAFQGRQAGGNSIVHLLCKLPWGSRIFHILYYDFASPEISPAYRDAKHLLFYVLPYNREPWPPSETGLTPLFSQGVHFRLFHLLLLATFFLAGRWMLHKLPVLPYYAAIRRIDDVLDGLTSSMSVTSRTGRWQPLQWVEGFFLDERVRQLQQEPVDPRTVEFLFLQILDEMREAAIRLPGARNQLISLPVPEITFVFDELDKLGSRGDPSTGLGENLAGQVTENLDAERRRSLELHKLFADMKNLLSSAPARFIFVGGRNLHDEWLADQASRQPLLTNIFNAEVYLPSLLTDYNRRETADLKGRVKSYVRHQYRRADNLYSQHFRKTSLPSFSLPAENLEGESFVQASFPPPLLPAPRLAETGDEFDEKEKEMVGHEITSFLAYRSMGNPKRLKELLGMFIRPVGRVVRSAAVRDLLDCQHVLSLDETDRFRIQIVARIFGALERSLKGGFARRDDKMTVSLFFLSDFLFKFHARAFSWSSLERVDELVHIHRAPDLREVLENLVEQWSDRVLQRIRNGMYDFRFQSVVTREIEHISRQSPEEMAAFNFTLDESQGLKSIYQASLERLQKGGSKELRDVVAGLGELHEFDQEYESARFYYRWAISLLDLELREVVGGSNLLEGNSPVTEIAAGWEAGPEYANLYMTWGIARLRLMLQVGMTFELSRNLERAEVEYRDARIFARSLLLAMLAGDDNTGADKGGRPHALNHFNLLFQPVFAEVWVAEKLEGAVDMSIERAEIELNELRQILPFVRNPLGPGVGITAGGHQANFALIMAEMYNKLGDLYFFKGRQVVSEEEIRNAAKPASPEPAGSTAPPAEPLRQGREGYLLRAHYHYAVALHELRRFTTFRQRHSAIAWNIWPEGKRWPTIASRGWPDIVYRAAGGIFNDFAEAMLGRISLYGLLADRRLHPKGYGTPGPSEANVDANRRTLIRGVTEWMESFEEDETATTTKSHPISIPLPEGTIEAGTLEGWLGTWTPTTSSAPEAMLLTYHEREGHSDLTRLVVALQFMLVGTKYLERGGYVEEAASELLKVAETVTTYLWWGRGVCQLIDWGLDDSADITRKLPLLSAVASARAAETWVHSYWAYLLEVGIYALQNADRLFRRSRRITKTAGYLLGDGVPPLAATLACSLGLAAIQWGRTETVHQRLQVLFSAWTGDPFVCAAKDLRSALRSKLEMLFQRHSYPINNRLRAIKTWIDDTTLRATFEERKDKGLRGDVFAATQEMIELNENFQAPLHFTPLHSGVTCSLVYLGFTGLSGKLDGGEDEETAERFRRAAQLDLVRSEEMSTMRRAFYESISRLFYLYDDFNDRQVHFNHAIQMAGSEIVSLLRYLVSWKDVGARHR